MSEEKKDKRIGNNFYLKRAKSGRDLLFSTPDILWKSACEYFNHVDENPWIKNEPIKSGDSAGTTMKVETSRPYTLSGLCIFLGCCQDTLSNYGNKEQYKDFFGVVKEIKAIVYTQKFEGAAVGAFNANLIARDLGLIDKKELNNKGTIQYQNVSKQFPNK
jgi:hypothetical protein